MTVQQAIADMPTIAQHGGMMAVTVTDPARRRRQLGRAVGDAMELAWNCLREALTAIEDAGFAVTETVVLTRPAVWRVRAGTYLPGGAQLHRINTNTRHPQAERLDALLNGEDRSDAALADITARLLREADRAIGRMLTAELELRLLTDEPALPWRTAAAYWRHLPEGFPILLPLKGVAEGAALAKAAPDAFNAFRRGMPAAELSSLTDNQLHSRFASSHKP